MRSRGFWLGMNACMLAYVGYAMWSVVPTAWSSGVRIPADRVAAALLGVAVGLAVTGPLLLIGRPRAARLARLTAQDVIGSTGVQLGYAAGSMVWMVGSMVATSTHHGSRLGSAVGGLAVSLLLASFSLSIVWWADRPASRDPDGLSLAEFRAG